MNVCVKLWLKIVSEILMKERESEVAREAGLVGWGDTLNQAVF